MVCVQECLSLAKEYTKQDIVGYYFEVSLAKEYTKDNGIVPSDQIVFL